MKLVTQLLFLTLISVLGGCSLNQVPPPTPPAAISWQEHQAVLRNILNWELSGKIGIRNENNSQSASLNWNQQGKHYQIDIKGPLGQGGASIEGQPGTVTVDVSGEGRFEGQDPEEILYTELGWILPINNIYWWIRGLPAPDTPYTHSLEDNRLAKLKQQGWQIDYLRYHPEAPYLPRKIRLSRDSLKITTVIHEWQPQK